MCNVSHTNYTGYVSYVSYVVILVFLNQLKSSEIAWNHLFTLNRIPFVLKILNNFC